MTSLIKTRASKSLIRCGVIVASLALAGNAFAANIPIPHPAARTTAHVTHGVVAHNHRPAAFQPAGIAQFFPGLFGLPIPVLVRGAATADTGGYDPTFDSPSPAVEVDNSQSQAAIDASDQAIQQEDQSLQDMDASIASTEQQNDAANAAAVQTDINAGM
jgi:hypothetical protein